MSMSQWFTRPVLALLYNEYDCLTYVQQGLRNTELLDGMSSFYQSSRAAAWAKSLGWDIWEVSEDKMESLHFDPKDSITVQG